MAGECEPDCIYHGMPDPPRHREWRQQPPPPRPVLPPDNWFWRLMYSLWRPPES